MSHEIRTPLKIILGFAQVLAHGKALSTDQRQGLASIRRAGESLLALINDILDLAKIEAGRMSLECAAFDPRRLIKETLSLFEPLARERGLELILDAGELPALIRGDKARLRQILINLLGNAVKFTETGSVTLRVVPGDAGRLAPYPDAWLAALRSAVELGDFVRIGGLLEQVTGRDPALDETLGRWAYAFDQDAFLKALDGRRRF